VIALSSNGISAVLANTAQPLTGSSNPSSWLEFPPVSSVRPGYTEIGDYIASQEVDEQRRALLERARSDLGDAIYGGKSDAGLRKIRLARGWSQTTLAKEIGTTQSHIARIENAELDPQASTLERLGQALGESPDAILRAFLAVKKAKESTGYGE